MPLKTMQMEKFGYQAETSPLFCASLGKTTDSPQFLSNTFYKTFRGTFGFMPKLTRVTYHGQDNYDPKALPDVEQKKLRRESTSKVVAFCVKSFVEELSKTRYVVGESNYVFRLFSIRRDYREAQVWGDFIGCPICTDSNRLSVDNANFRSAENVGRVHLSGPHLDEVISEEDTPSRADDLAKVPCRLDILF
jgi:hypothetical protein